MIKKRYLGGWLIIATQLRRLFQNSRLVFFCWLISTLLMGTVYSESTIERESISVIQERIYDKKHELTTYIGYIPDDDFYNEYPVAISYTYNFNKYLAWEVGRLQYFFNDEKELKAKLQSLDLVAVSFDRLQLMTHSSFILKPTYGKDSLWGHYIINHETFYSLGAGFAQYERSYSFGEPSTETVISITAGVGRRYFLSKNFAFLAEVKSYTQFKDTKTETNIYLGLGFSYRFNFSERNNSVRKKTNPVYKYLNDKNE